MSSIVQLVLLYTVGQAVCLFLLHFWAKLFLTLVSDEELFGDFEDLETGEVYETNEKHGAESEEEQEAMSEDDREKQEEEQPLNKSQRMEAKKQKKAAFDAQYPHTA